MFEPSREGICITGSWCLGIVERQVYMSPGAPIAVQLFVSFYVSYKRIREREG
jgi:hypothetical protein